MYSSKWETGNLHLRMWIRLCRWMNDANVCGWNTLREGVSWCFQFATWGHLLQLYDPDWRCSLAEDVSPGPRSATLGVGCLLIPQHWWVMWQVDHLPKDAHLDMNFSLHCLQNQVVTSPCSNLRVHGVRCHAAICLYWPLRGVVFSTPPCSLHSWEASNAKA